MVSSFARLQLEGRSVSVSTIGPSRLEAGCPGTPYLLPIGPPAAGQPAKLMPFAIITTSGQELFFIINWRSKIDLII